VTDPRGIEPDRPVFVISVAAQLSGLHAQTLRSYDRLGLVSPGRSAGGGRRYSPRDIALLREVQRLSQEEGVNLAGIKRIIELEQLVHELQARVDEMAAELDAARAALRALPGVGVWTAAEVARVALGDPDAVSEHDFHLPNLVSWNLAGEPRGTDERMLELLEPYRGQRGRVQRLLEAGGAGAPRFGPRQPVNSIRLPSRVPWPVVR
jgi:MerR family transcriptional regulator/heat shock protein HspR